MTGVVLCGGQSIRMQSDKGLMQTGNDRWAQRMVNLLLPVCDHVVVSINREQQAYRKILSSCSFVSDDDTLRLKGPLSGVLSVHAAYPKEDLLVMACDLQQMVPDVPAHLMKILRSQGYCESLVFKHKDGSAEPLCSIYTARGLARMYALHQRQGLPRYSMKYLLEQLDVHYVAVPEKWLHCFRNFNTPEEINAVSD